MSPFTEVPIPQDLLNTAVYIDNLISLEALFSEGPEDSEQAQNEKDAWEFAPDVITVPSIADDFKKRAQWIIEPVNENEKTFTIKNVKTDRYLLSTG